MRSKKYISDEDARKHGRSLAQLIATVVLEREDEAPRKLARQLYDLEPEQEIVYARSRCAFCKKNDATRFVDSVYACCDNIPCQQDSRKKYNAEHPYEDRTSERDIRKTPTTARRSRGWVWKHDRPIVEVKKSKPDGSLP